MNFGGRERITSPLKKVLYNSNSCYGRALSMPSEPRHTTGGWWAASRDALHFGKPGKTFRIRYFREFLQIFCSKISEDTHTYTHTHHHPLLVVTFFFNEIECKKGRTSKMQPLCISKSPCITNEKGKLFK